MIRVCDNCKRIVENPDLLLRVKVCRVDAIGREINKSRFGKKVEEFPLSLDFCGVSCVEKWLDKVRYTAGEIDEALKTCEAYK